MENDFLFSYPGALVDFIHASDCGHAAGFGDFSAGIFSGSVLDTVSEDPIHELDDEGLFASLDSAGTSCETPLVSEKGRLFSSDSEGHNSDVLRDSVPNTPTSNLNGLCNPSLNLGQVPETNDVPSVLEGGNAVSALGSWTINSDRMGDAGTSNAIHQLSGLNLECHGEGKSFVNAYSLRGLVERSDVLLPSLSAASTPELSLLEHAAASKSELTMSPVLLTQKPHALGDPDDGSQNVVSSVLGLGEVPHSLIVACASGLSDAHSLDYEMNTIERPLADSDSTEVLDERLFNSAKLHNLDFSELFRRMDYQGDSLSPLARTVRIPQSRMIQRSLSSNALGQSGNVTYTDRAAEYSMLTQSAPLYSSVNRLVLPAAQPQVHPTDAGQTNRMSCNSIRRVFSTGDLQTLNGMPVVQEGGSPLHSDSTILDERTFKIGRYTLEERKSRIHRYRQKRTERNFSKKIKYACRKTLADSRPRVRGRFAKNDEMEDIFVNHNGLLNHDDEDMEVRFQPSRMFGYWL